MSGTASAPGGSGAAAADSPPAAPGRSGAAQLPGKRWGGRRMTPIDLARAALAFSALDHPERSLACVCLEHLAALRASAAAATSASASVDMQAAALLEVMTTTSRVCRRQRNLRGHAQRRPDGGHRSPPRVAGGAGHSLHARGRRLRRPCRRARLSRALLHSPRSARTAADPGSLRSGSCSAPATFGLG